MLISEVLPGLTVQEVKAVTGWDVRIAPDVCETARPTQEDVRLLRDYDVRLLRDYIDTVPPYLRRPLLNALARPSSSASSAVVTGTSRGVALAT